MKEEDFERIDRMLARRDPWKLPATLDSINGWAELAEEVPGLLAEVRKQKTQNEDWEKMVRGIADRLYAVGKEWRDHGDAQAGDGMMEIATELHRRCKIVKGEKPLPAAGERLTTPECTCTIDGTPHCRARGTGYCLAENPEGLNRCPKCKQRVDNVIHFCPGEERKCEHCGQRSGWRHSPGCKNEPASAKFR